MKKKLLIGCVSILVLSIGVGVGIHNRNKKIAEEKYLKEEVEKIEMTDEQKNWAENSLMAGSDEWNDVYDQSEDDYFEFTKEEVVQTRDIGVKFLECVRPYEYDKGISDETAKEIKKLTTKGLGDMLSEQLQHLRPATVVNFRKMEIGLIEPIQYKKYEDGTVDWEIAVLENAINESGNIAKERVVSVNLLFIKDNNQWKIGEYSVDQ
ncbi:MAG: hypothetical protein NSGCLCUN01_02713 [uncultured Clostridium sp.]